METIDTVCAYALEAGDLVQHEGITYEVKEVVDNGYVITVFVEPLDSTDGEETLVFGPDEAVNLMGYVYEDA